MSEATSKSTPMRPYPFGLLRPHRDRPSRRRPPSSVMNSRRPMKAVI